MWFRNNKRIVKTNYQLIDQIYRCTSDLFNIEECLNSVMKKMKYIYLCHSFETSIYT